MTVLEQAQSLFEAGEFGRAREVALEGLAADPDNMDLVRLAGRAGVEIGSDDAVEQLRRVTELQADSKRAWSDLGDALAAEGRTDEANDAFRKVLEIDPEDDSALTALGHSAFGAGERGEAVSMLEQVAERTRGASTAAISLVEMYRTLGRPEEALAAAQRVAAADPGDALHELDVAELSLETGRHHEALEAFARLREVVDLPDDEVAALHGMIKAELVRDRKERALELAREAGAIDTVGRSAAVLAYLEADLGVDESPDDAIARGATTFIQMREVPPSRAEVDALLDTTLSDLRGALSNGDRTLSAGEDG